MSATIIRNGRVIDPANKRDEVADLVILQDAERRRIAETVDVQERDAAVVEEVERQDREQHDHRSRQRVDEELDRGVEFPRTAPDADDEVHRHEHDFPENVEEEEVERAERADHARL